MMFYPRAPYQMTYIHMLTAGLFERRHYAEAHCINEDHFAIVISGEA